MELVFLACAAFFAGFVDSIVGGGGLIQIPALFSAYPNQIPATLLGTNKFASVWGTAVAARNYLKNVSINWGMIVYAIGAAFACSLLGAYLVTQMPPHHLRKILPFILVAVAIYTFRKKDFGLHHQPKLSAKQEVGYAALIAAVIGLYDGFFGPGTGSFFMFFFVRVFGYDFIRASAFSKVLNVACNIAALMWFGYSNHVIWALGAAIAVCNVAGSMTGSRLAIKHGSGFVRKIFLFVVCALIIKTCYDAFFR